jgi:hypothetical protein
MPVVRRDQDPTRNPQSFQWHQRKCTLRSNTNNSSSTLLGMAQGQATAADKTCPRTVHGTSPRATASTIGGPTPETFSMGRVEATGGTPETSTDRPWALGGGTEVPLHNPCTIVALAQAAPPLPTTGEGATSSKAPPLEATPCQPQAQAAMQWGLLLKQASAQ